MTVLKNRICAQLLTTLLLGFAFSVSPLSGTEAQDNYLRVEVQPIIDKYGFLRPVTAGFFLKPVGWTFQGGVDWRNEYSCTWGHATQWQISSPDNKYSLAHLPHQRWYYSSDPDPRYARASCGYVPYQKRIVSLEAYLRFRLDALGLNARNVKYTSHPVPPQLKQANFNRKTSDGSLYRGKAEVGEVSFTFAGPTGEMEGRLGGVGTFLQNITQPVQLGFGQVLPSVDFGSGYVFFVHLSVAPKGRYDDRLLGTIVRSEQIVSEYNNAIIKHNGKLDQQDVDRMWRVGQITYKTNQEIFEMIQNSWEERQASMDRDVERFLDVINEVRPYEEPNDPNSQIKVGIQFDSVWKLDDGSYIFGVGRGFDPRQAVGIGGVELKPATNRQSIRDWYRNSLPIE